MKTIKGPKRKCFLCKTVLMASAYADLFVHPPSETCQVNVTDVVGISVDETYELDRVTNQVWSREAPAIDLSVPIEFGGAIFTVDGQPVVAPGLSDTAFLSIDAAARMLFEAVGQPYLGGSSGDRGWSSISTFQRCPYLWKDKYGGARSVLGDAPGPEALEIGSMVHLFLAVYYSQRIDPLFPFDAEAARRYLQLAPVTPAYLAAAWDLFEGYRLWWGDETSWMTPLAVEEQVVDPHTGASCRWDLVFRVNQPYENMLPGVYVCDHKTSSDNGLVTHAQWRNDGQILGEIDLYERLKFHKKWGPLRGACINHIVKTKTPQYNRSFVYPAKGILRDHRKGLQIWSAQMDLAEATGNYPRARAACITRFRGLCELFEHCSGADGSEPREIEL